MAMRKIDVDVEVEIKDGYEFLRLDRYATTDPNECLQGVVKLNGIKYFVIARKAWQWPEWLTAEWIAKDKSAWYGYQNRPVVTDGEWKPGSGMFFFLNPAFVDFTPPPCTDWTQSLRRNPRAEVTQ